MRSATSAVATFLNEGLQCRLLWVVHQTVNRNLSYHYPIHSRSRGSIWFYANFNYKGRTRTSTGTWIAPAAGGGGGTNMALESWTACRAINRYVKSRIMERTNSMYCWQFSTRLTELPTPHLYNMFSISIFSSSLKDRWVWPLCGSEKEGKHIPLQCLKWHGPRWCISLSEEYSWHR